MAQAKALVKVAVVASSVLLVTGLVSYRAGTLHWLRGTPPPVDGNTATIKKAATGLNEPMPRTYLSHRIRPLLPRLKTTQFEPVPQRETTEEVPVGSA